jgi:signal transduction histidine kinase
MPTRPRGVDGETSKRDIDSSQVLDNLPDGITIQDRSFKVIYQNRSMITAFGKRVGETCYAAYERRDSICEGCGVARAFLSGKPVLVLRTAFDASGGTSYWENACFPIYDDGGNIVAGAEICRNVSDRVGLEEEVKKRNIELGQLNKQLRQQAVQLNEAVQQLRREIRQREQAELQLRQAQKLRAVGQLAAGVAHELNTPAQFVGDSVHFLADSFGDVQTVLAKYRKAVAALDGVPGCEATLRELQKVEEDTDLDYVERNAPAAFERARDGIGRISSIVSAMKEFAHPDQREKSAADLNRALEMTLTIARNEYNYIADVETEFGELPPVICHVGDLNQVFLNLLVNAAHAIADVVGKEGRRGIIRVRTAREGDRVRIEVSDTGCGICESIRDRIFEPFFTTKEVGRGSGQGLAIARSLVVDKHGGSLTFESEVGKGTTFIIVLPIEGDAHHPLEDRAGADGAPDLVSSRSAPR